MPFSEKYKREAIVEIPAKGLSGKTAWSSPSNIALVKYWGKRSPQIPLNPSLSFTLSKARTITKVEYSISKIRSGTILQYAFEGKRNGEFERRVLAYLNTITAYLPFLKNIDLKIDSENTFPHSSGIASSASAFSALALALTEIEFKLKEIRHFSADFYKKASFLARLGSGSAARSLYGGTVLWGETRGHAEASNELAIPVNDIIHPVFADYKDVVLILDKRKKSVSSSAGHALMNKNPFADERFKQAEANTQKLLGILQEGNIDEFVDLVEYEAFCLHALMLSSFPGYFLFKPATIAVIEDVRNFRSSTGVPLAFTLDAGANVHLLFPESESGKVMNFISQALIKYCVDGDMLEDGVGRGPAKI